MKMMYVKIYFTEGVLATRPNDEKIMTRFIADKAPNAKTRDEEIAAKGPEEIVERETTIYPRTKMGKPHFWDYQWKGYFKEKASFIRKNTTDDTGKKKPLSAGVKAFKKEIDGNTFVYPRKIVINTDESIYINQRPLRAGTPQGEIVALNSSEEIKARATCEFQVECMIDNYTDLVREWLDYGIRHGTGQWRNSGEGRFLWAELDEDGNQIGGNFTPEKYAKILAANEL